MTRDDEVVQLRAENARLQAENDALRQRAGGGARDHPPAAGGPVPLGGAGG
jgi:hypothetical protein